MDFDLWYLLVVPILFGAGWIARSFDIKEKKTIADETQTLYKGVDLLLSNKPEQAIDSFINLTKVDPDTVEMHYSLGGLFRRRGEFDKAIRIHNHLRNRADLSKKEKARALYELGLDYLKAGVWDRAEKCFKECSETHSSLKVQAQRELLNIYETEKEWQKAIDQANLLERQGSEKNTNRISELYCELAQQSLMQKDFKGAASNIEKALAANAHHKRALIMKGNLLKLKGDIEGAISAWKEVGQISPAYETLVIEPIVKTLIESGNTEQAVKYLEGVCERANNNDDFDAALRLLSKQIGNEQAIGLLQAHLEKQPTLLGFSRLISLSLEEDPDNKNLKQLQNLLKSQVDKTYRYKCSKCGFATRKFLWRCPGCYQWETFPPSRSENFSGR